MLLAPLVGVNRPKPEVREWVRGRVRTRCVCDPSLRPRRSFMPAINRLNSLAKAAVAALHQDARVAFVDCGQPFVERTTGKREGVKRALMPDALHPNASGHRLLASCVADGLARWRWRESRAPA